VEVRASPLTWITRALWLTLPLTLGDLLAGALDGRSDAVVVTGAVLSWGLWTATLLASLVLLPLTLLALRVMVPLALVAGVLAAIDTAPDLLGWIGLVSAAIALVTAMSADVGIDFVNGASYGDERRFPLRPPAALLLGPVPLVWASMALPLPAAALALAARQWVLGVVVGLLGAAALVWGTRVLSRLTARWCVFVPAGITIVDDMALVDPVLLRAEHVVRLGPAPVDTTATDLSVGATGLILQVDLSVPVAVVPVVRRGGVTEATEVGSLLFAPSRPGALLAHAATRRIGVASA
jgi:hypothetical protein